MGRGGVLIGDERGDNQTTASDRGWQIGAVVPLGAMVFQVGYAREKQTSAAGFKGSNTAVAAHLTYPLSKRTSIYAEALTGKKVAATAARAETKDRIFGLGLKHDF